jgi:hypothetical protein
MKEFTKELEALANKYKVRICSNNIRLEPMDGKQRMSFVTRVENYTDGCGAEGEFVKITYIPKKYPAPKFVKREAPQINGFKEFISPIDGKRIASNAALKDHEKRHNVVQVGNELKGKGKTLDVSREHSKLKQQGKI